MPAQASTVQLALMEAPALMEAVEEMGSRITDAAILIPPNMRVELVELWHGELMAEMAVVAALPIPTGVMELLGVRMAKRVPPLLAERPEEEAVQGGHLVGLVLGVTVVGVTMEVTGITVVTGLRARQVRRVLPAALWEDGGSLVGRAEQALRVSMVEEAVAAVVGEDRTTATSFVAVTTLVQVGVVAELVARVVLAARADGAAAAATASSWSLTGRVVRSWIAQ
jgi:hypothetical protein